MKKFLLVALAFHAIFFSAQKKDNCTDIMKRWDGWDIYKKPTTESVKKCISKDERKIKIEVIDPTDYKYQGDNCLFYDYNGNRGHFIENGIDEKGKTTYIWQELEHNH